jgi:putative transposase
MKKRFTEEQIIKVLEEAKTGLKVEEVCRKHGISPPTYYNWKAKYGGMPVSEIKRLRILEKENQSLKKLVADLSLDNVALKDALSRKW